MIELQGKTLSSTTAFYRDGWICRELLSYKIPRKNGWFWNRVRKRGPCSASYCQNL